MPTRDAPGMPFKNACTPRSKSRLSYTFWTVASSGNPSKNFSVPRLVSTESGVVMEDGMGVVIFIFGGVCEFAVPEVNPPAARVSIITRTIPNFMLFVSP